MKKLLFFTVSVLCFYGSASSQNFPNPATLSTGQGSPGALDPIWIVSPWYSTSPPNPMGLSYIPALINNNCAPGSWVNPATLPPPVNNGNWITGSDGTCSSNTNDGYRYFRLTLNLPADCNGNSVATTGSYTLYLSGYADNTISDVYVNGTSTGISGGSYSSPLNITLTGPWVAGINYVDVLVYNFPNGGNQNPYGLLLVANSTASSVADGDGDGVPDINDQCPCMYGTLANGCMPVSIAGDTVICAGDSTMLTATGFGAYAWNDGETTASITVAPATTSRYSVISTTSNGYTDSAVINVTVNQLPIPAINPASAAICLGNNVTLTASGGPAYTWGTAATTAAITVSPSATTAYTVTVTDANGCSASTTANVTVNQLPTAAINPSSATICNGDNTTLTATGGTGFLWSNASTTAAITVAPAATTSYSVTLTDANTCTATASATVTVNPLPIATINPSTVSICIGASTTLTASGGTSYAWDAQANSANTAAVSLSPTSTTSYSVTVTDANSCSSTATSTVTVNPLPVPSVSPAQTAICNGAGTTLTANGGTSYLWSNNVTTAANTIAPTANTTYTVTATDANACTATASADVTVNPLPVATITPATVTICTGASTTLTAAGGLTYTWSNSSITDSISVTPASSSIYSVTASDVNGCTASANANVTVVPLMVLTATPINVTCFGDNNGSVALNTGSGQQPYNYMWSDGETNQNITGLAPNNYTVTVTDNAGCTATASATITEPTVLSVTETSANPTCESNSPDGSVTLTVSGGTTPYQYVWSNGAATQNIASLAPGTYEVTVTDNNNCSASVASTLTYQYSFSVHANPTPSVNLGESATLSYTVTGNTGNYTNVWSPASLVACSSCDSTQSYTNVTTLYQIKIENDSGCVATDTVTVTVIPNYSLFVPNAFTPNGDGNNDVFAVYGNKNALRYFQIEIFNRIGEMVFESNDYNFTWDGTYKGALQSSSVYTWQMKATFTDGHREELRKGTLTLLR